MPLPTAEEIKELDERRKLFSKFFTYYLEGDASDVVKHIQINAAWHAWEAAHAFYVMGKRPDWTKD